jgi:hypothetical protein
MYISVYIWTCIPLMIHGSVTDKDERTSKFDFTCGYARNPFK